MSRKRRDFWYGAFVFSSTMLPILIVIIVRSW